MKSKTISNEYVEQLRQLHAAPRGFGGDGHKRLTDVLALIEHYQVTTLLDYGAGQGTLKRELDKVSTVVTINYDPAVEAYSNKPAGRFDMVVCTDVLEHVELEYLDAVLNEIYGYTRKVAFLLIAFLPANKVLPDGRNAHILQRSPDWWHARLGEMKWHDASWSYHYDKDRETIKKGLYVLEKQA